MKGLLLKDLYVIKNGCRPYLFTIAVFTVFTFLPNNNTYLFFSIYSIILTFMLTLTIIAYDEKSKWEIYCDTLPCSRKNSVTSKYIIALSLVFTVWIVLSITRFLNLSINGAVIGSEYFAYIFQLLILGIIYPSLTLPGIFKFGTQKGRLINLITIICAFTIAYLFYYGAINIHITLITTTAIAIAALPISWLLSVKLYESREF